MDAAEAGSSTDGASTTWDRDADRCEVRGYAGKGNLADTKSKMQSRFWVIMICDMNYGQPIYYYCINYGNVDWHDSYCAPGIEGRHDTDCYLGTEN